MLIRFKNDDRTYEIPSSNKHCNKSSIMRENLERLSYNYDTFEPIHRFIIKGEVNDYELLNSLAELQLLAQDDVIAYLNTEAEILSHNLSARAVALNRILLKNTERTIFLLINVSDYGELITSFCFVDGFLIFRRTTESKLTLEDIDDYFQIMYNKTDFGKLCDNGCGNGLEYSDIHDLVLECDTYFEYEELDLDISYIPDLSSGSVVKYFSNLPKYEYPISPISVGEYWNLIDIAKKGLNSYAEGLSLRKMSYSGGILYFFN